MRARVSTLWYFLQGIIEIRCLTIRDGARMVLCDRDEGGRVDGPGALGAGNGQKTCVVFVFATRRGGPGPGVASRPSDRDPGVRLGPKD